jgi:DNA-binding beta-propeller fold protein YncE
MHTVPVGHGFGDPGKRLLKAALVMALAALLTQGAATSGDHTLVVFHPGPHAVDEIDPATGKILHQLTVEDQPHEAAISPDGRTIYATLPAAGAVVAIDAATLTLKTKIECDFFKAPPHPQGRKGGMSTSASPHALAISDDGNKLYVGLSWRDHPGVVVYDLKGGKALSKIDLPASGEFQRIQPGKDRLFVPTREGLVVIDTKSEKIAATVPIKGNPVGVDFTRGGEIWTSENGDGTVTVVDGRTYQIVKTLQTEGKGAGRMAVSADGKWAAATHETTEDVILFDIAKKEIAGTVAIGKGASLPVFSPDSTKLYVMTAGGPCTEGCPGNVVVIDPREAKLTARYKVADDAFAVVVRFPDRK